MSIFPWGIWSYMRALHTKSLLPRDLSHTTGVRGVASLRRFGQTSSVCVQGERIQPVPDKPQQETTKEDLRFGPASEISEAGVNKTSEYFSCVLWWAGWFLPSQYTRNIFSGKYLKFLTCLGYFTFDKWILSRIEGVKLDFCEDPSCIRYKKDFF